MSMGVRWAMAVPVVALSAFLLCGTASCQTGSRSSDIVPGEVLVKFRAGVPVTTIEAIHRRIGAQVVQAWPEIRWQRVTVPAGVSVADAIREYRRYPEVEDAEPNFIQRVQPSPAPVPPR